MGGAQNVVLIRGPRIGKTHAATGLDVEAGEHYRGTMRFFSTIELSYLFFALEDTSRRQLASCLASAGNAIGTEGPRQVFLPRSQVHPVARPLARSVSLAPKYRIALSRSSHRASGSAEG